MGFNSGFKGLKQPCDFSQIYVHCENYGPISKSFVRVQNIVQGISDGSFTSLLNRNIRFLERILKHVVNRQTCCFTFAMHHTCKSCFVSCTLVRDNVASIITLPHFICLYSSPFTFHFGGCRGKSDRSVKKMNGIFILGLVLN